MARYWGHQHTHGQQMVVKTNHFFTVTSQSNAEYFHGNHLLLWSHCMFVWGSSGQVAHMLFSFVVYSLFDWTAVLLSYSTSFSRVLLWKNSEILWMSSDFSHCLQRREHRDTQTAVHTDTSNPSVILNKTPRNFLPSKHHFDAFGTFFSPITRHVFNNYCFVCYFMLLFKYLHSWIELNLT